MSEFTATISGEELDVKFQIWRNYIQKPKWELDTFTRLGGSKIIVQKTRKLSNPSQIEAQFLSNDIAEIDAHIESLLNAIGEFVTVTYYGETISNVLILDVQYNKRAVSGPYQHLIDYALFLRAEEVEDD